MDLLIESPSRPSRQWVWLRLVVWVLPVILAAAMATQSRFDRHPDEYAHLDGFRYFSENLWPPDLNADGIVYSHYGWSRVYTGQIAYWVVGRLYAGIGEPLGLELLAFCRWSNVVLLGLVLAVLLVGANTRWRLWVLAAFLGAVPQVVYLFSYANSDAWGVAAAILLFANAARLAEREGAVFTLGQACYLGILLGILGGSKTVHLVGAILPLAILYDRARRDRRTDRPGRRSLGRYLGIAVGLAVAVNVPLKMVYPQSQGNWSEQERAMREERAKDGFKPSDPHYFGYRLAEKGYGYRKMLRQFDFFEEFLESSYAKFGYMNVAMPGWIYRGILGMVLILLLMRILDLRVGTSVEGSGGLVWFGLSGFLVLAMIFGLLTYCLTVDFQAQGRYALPIAAVVYALLFGRRGEGLPATDRWRTRILVLCWVLAVVIFIVQGIRNPWLQG